MSVSQAVASSGARPFRMIKGQSTLSDLADGAGIGMGVGNVYYVCQTTNTTVYNELLDNKQRSYPDGSMFLHSTIQSALDATVECRNDYVIVMPDNSDYDLTASLTLSKKSVHLVGSAGLGYDRGTTNACRIEQTGAGLEIFTVTDSAVEIAGFYCKPKIGYEHVTLSASAYAPYIHHNSFLLWWTDSNAASIAGTTAGGGWGSIERNWFVSYGGNDKTCAVIVDIGSQATAARVNYNDFMIGDGCTATIGINNAATKGSCNYNTFAKAGADGDYGHCIAIGAWGTAIGNRGTVEDSIMVTGGAGDESLSDNMNGVDGGLVDADS